MSTTTTTGKRAHAAALQEALQLQRFFDGTYERWEFAGSLRRRVAEVGDVEIVVIPKLGTKPAAGLFAEPVPTNLLLDRLDQLVSDDSVRKHVYGTMATVVEGEPSVDRPIYRWGEKYRGVDFHGFNHEFFCADLDNWGPTLAIRTGPAEFSKTLVTRLNISHHRNKGGYVWQCDRCNRCDGRSNSCPFCEGTGLIPVHKISVPDEREYFKLASVPYLEPHARR